VLQFVTESIVIASVSLVLSFILIYLLLPAFNTLANKQLPYSYILRLPVLVSLLGMILFIGIVGGSYPAFYLSSFNPVQVLKGKIASKGGNALFRKGLVVLQFGISIFMLISTLVVFDQLQYMRTKDLGFKKERVVRLNLTEREMRKRADVIVNSLKQNSEVVAVGMANASPGEGIGKNLLKVEENDGKFSDRGIDLYTADFDFVKTMGMTIVTGRDFSRDIISDTTSAVLVNEAMVARMGWKEPLGKKFRFQTGDPKNPTQDKQVVGVVKDYHQNSLYDAIEPLLIIFDKRNNYVFVRTDQGDPKQTLAAIEKTWKQVFPSFPFEYVFLDQDFNSQYKADEKRSQIFTVFSGLTIFIACLGLLGLAAFSTQQRSKEIGIRKVIGAQVQSLFYLVSKEFFLLVTIGIVLAFPVAWYFTNSWLSNFAYRIELMAEWPTFIASAFLALVITLLTVGFHVIKAATANPVKTLRDE
jgi:putative ABC transport system permease protein